MAQRENKSEPPDQQGFKCRFTNSAENIFHRITLFSFYISFFCASLNAIQQRLSTKQDHVIEPPMQASFRCSWRVDLGTAVLAIDSNLPLRPRLVSNLLVIFLATSFPKY